MDPYGGVLGSQLPIWRLFGAFGSEVGQGEMRMKGILLLVMFKIGTRL